MLHGHPTHKVTIKLNGASCCWKLVTSENSPVPFEIGDVVKWVLVRFFFFNKIHYFSSSLLVDVSASFGNAFFFKNIHRTLWFTHVFLLAIISSLTHSTFVLRRGTLTTSCPFWTSVFCYRSLYKVNEMTHSFYD